MVSKPFGVSSAGPKDLRGKNIWIIGASSGLGAALAWVFALEGANVALSARALSALQEVRRHLQGGSHIVAPLDVTDPPSMQRAYHTIREQWGDIDYVVYCAGIYEPPQWDPFDSAAQLNILDTNLGGVFRLLEIMLPQWREQQRGHLLLIGSITALGGTPQSLAYGASKAGMAHLAESLSIELEPYRVAVQLASPGLIDTPMLAKLPRRPFCVVAPDKAAWHIRRRLGTSTFEIHFPKRLTLPAKFLRWAFPRRWYLAATRRSVRKNPGTGQGSSILKPVK